MIIFFLVICLLSPFSNRNEIFSIDFNLKEIFYKQNINTIRRIKDPLIPLINPIGFSDGDVIGLNWTYHRDDIDWFNYRVDKFLEVRFKLSQNQIRALTPSSYVELTLIDNRDYVGPRIALPGVIIEAIRNTTSGELNAARLFLLELRDAQTGNLVGAYYDMSIAMKTTPPGSLLQFFIPFGSRGLGIDKKVLEDIINTGHDLELVIRILPQNRREIIAGSIGIRKGGRIVIP
ncbi:MAG: hypothetical protein NC834_04995 [Candidatus Omnitrophica bacterium]|nr:hypothetical protein [Candidatus Omnitrophota bacterium]